MSALQVIGDPVLHSKSPLIHGAMLCELGLDTPYTAHVVKKGGLADYLDWAKANGITGFNATMPHKEDLLPFMDELGRDAARCGAVNTVCLRDGRLIGHNTDGAGCLAALEEAGLWPARRVVVLGAGGVSKAMALKLAASGAERVWVCNRTVEKAAALCAIDGSGVMTAAGFNTGTLSELCAQADLLINGTNLGMAGCPGQFADFSFLNALPAGAGVFDAIYHPAETELLAQAKKRGLAVCNGLPMLVHQAIFALEYFLDLPLDHARMGAVVRAALV